MPDQRPNVLLVMSDQHNARVMGCAGDPVARTPAMDRLARTGTLFCSAYCPFPLCGPSRMAFMTGQRPSRIDCLDNASQLGSDIPTFAHAFSAAGYQTVLAGRMHFVGPDQRHGFDSRLVSDVTTAYVNRGWNLEPVLGDLIDTPGYSTQSLRKSGPGRTGYQAYDEAVTSAAVEWLRGRPARAGEPFLLTVGLVSPHCPFVAPPDLYGLYHGRAPAPPAEDQPAAHPGLAALRRASSEPPASAGDRARARAAYYGLCTMVDTHLQRILDALDEGGHAERTVVVYTSDHGDQLGEHGLWWKSTFYEGSVRVPLLMAGPGLPMGAAVGGPVSLVDVGPTLLDLASLAPLPSAEGRSFRCLLEGRPEEWPDLVTAEGLTAVDGGAPMRMVRGGPWKLNWYAGHPPELFNLEADPHECADRHADAACAHIVARLTARALEDWDPDAIARRVRARLEELELLRAHLCRLDPPEPDPLWYAEPAENRVDAPPAGGPP